MSLAPRDVERGRHIVGVLSKSTPPAGGRVDPRATGGSRVAVPARQPAAEVVHMSADLPGTIGS